MLSKRMETATKFVDHYATHDNDVLHALLADDLVYEFAPSRSLDNLKAMDKAGYLELKMGMKLAMTGYPLDVNKYIEGESANIRCLDIARAFLKEVQIGVGPRALAEMFKLTQNLVVVVWATGSPQWRDELKDYAMFTEEEWTYVGEFVFMLTMDEKGEKITKIVEFVDSKGTDNKITPLMMRALGNLQNLKEPSGTQGLSKETDTV